MRVHLRASETMKLLKTKQDENVAKGTVTNEGGVVIRTFKWRSKQYTIIHVKIRLNCFYTRKNILNVSLMCNTTKTK